MYSHARIFLSEYRLSVLSILVIWLLLVTGVAQAAQIEEVLDQQHAPVGDFPTSAVANDRTQIQTFTVGITGTLTRIEVEVSRETDTVDDLVLSLWTTDASGLPDELLATASVPASAVELHHPSFVSFDLSSAGVSVTAGDLLAITLDSDAPNNPDTLFAERYAWEYGGFYPFGNAYTQIGTTISAQFEDFHFKTYVEPAPAITAVTIDIRPGSDTNPINPTSQGIIQVALLTTDTLDATSVDPSTVRFGRSGTEAVAVRSTLEDVNGDGRPDLILYFRTQETGIQCGDTSALLTGSTTSGQMIQGTDVILTVGCK